jgi:hypothetical protein
MGSISTHTKKRITVSTPKTDVNILDLTSKNQKRMTFTPVTKEERERLRVPTYAYIL